MLRRRRRRSRLRTLPTPPLSPRCGAMVPLPPCRHPRIVTQSRWERVTLLSRLYSLPCGYEAARSLPTAPPLDCTGHSNPVRVRRESLQHPRQPPPSRRPVRARGPRLAPPKQRPPPSRRPANVPLPRPREPPRLLRRRTALIAASWPPWRASSLLSRRSSG